MITFEEWLIENHTELMDENWKHNISALTLGAASLFPMASTQAEPPSHSQTKMTQPVDQNQQSRLDAMKRVSIVHRFKKQWGSLQEPDNDQKLFNFVLKFQTEDDHNLFLDVIKKRKEEIFHVQFAFSRPFINKDEEKLKTKEISNSYDCQYIDYIKAIVLASKINLR